MNLRRIRNISLKWKLLIPFLVLSIAGISATVLVAVRSHVATIESQERQLLVGHYEHFLLQIENRSEMLGSLALSLALYPEVGHLFASRDRQGLYEFLRPQYHYLRKSFGLDQLHFHLPEAVSFLRIHEPDLHGDPLYTYRASILQASKRRTVLSGLERGRTGIGLRGVAPVIWEDQVVGTVEVGWNIGQGFLDMLKSRLEIDACLIGLHPEGYFENLFFTRGWNFQIPETTLAEALGSADPLLLIATDEAPHSSLLLGGLRDYSGLTILLLGVALDRSAVEQKIRDARNVMLGLQAAAILASSILIYCIVLVFLRPIKEIVHMAGEIAAGKRSQRLAERDMDEMGRLGESLNRMLDSMNRSREKLEEYATALKSRVAERTNDLIASEEKYRTLVENVPLLVYRTTPDGILIFVNHYVETLLGVSVEDVIGKRYWLKNHVLPEDLTRMENALRAVIEEGGPVSVEYRCRTSDGRVVYVADHAIPHKNANGVIQYVDGIMVDTTEHHNLQEKIIRSEELKTLHDVSMQLAHEIRNPLVSVGGFARRLLKLIPEHDPTRQIVNIIVTEAARLEMILKMILSYIQPFDLHTESTDVNALIEQTLGSLDVEFKANQCAWRLDADPGLRKLSLDPAQIASVFDTLFRNALRKMPEGGTLNVSSQHLPETSHIEIRYPVKRLSQDDIEHFFFPFVGTDLANSDLDLSRAKMVIHKHEGMIDVGWGGERELLVTIDLPNS